jgi:hypothetical protein
MKTRRHQTQAGNETVPAKPVTPLPTPPTLLENEWNFDEARVPAPELEVCCYWEYARESEFIRNVRERFRAMANWTMDFAGQQEWVGTNFRKIEASIGRTAFLFQGDVRDFDSNTWLKMGALSPRPRNPAPPEPPPESKTCFKIVASPFPEPWQSIPRDVRVILVKTAAPLSALLPAFRWASRFYARQMADLCEAQNPPPNEPAKKWGFPLRTSMKPGGIQEEFWGNKPREERPSRLFANGEERLIVEIDWGRFTNEQIVACFEKWVRVHQPKNVDRPDGRGQKKIEWRVALERLGVMRAMNAYEHPDGNFLETVKKGARKTRRLDHQRARETFRKLFPFLPEGEEPIHWQVKADHRP